MKEYLKFASDNAINLAKQHKTQKVTVNSDFREMVRARVRGF